MGGNVWEWVDIDDNFTKVPREDLGMENQMIQGYNATKPKKCQLYILVLDV